MAETAETCALSSSSKEVYSKKGLCALAIHMARLYPINMEIQNE